MSTLSPYSFAISFKKRERFLHSLGHSLKLALASGMWTEGSVSYAWWFLFAFLLFCHCHKKNVSDTWGRAGSISQARPDLHLEAKPSRQARPWLTIVYLLYMHGMNKRLCLNGTEILRLLHGIILTIAK